MKKYLYLGPLQSSGRGGVEGNLFLTISSLPHSLGSFTDKEDRALAYDLGVLVSYLGSVSDLLHDFS